MNPGETSTGVFALDILAIRNPVPKSSDLRHTATAERGVESEVR
jgi:hypothetical protein